MEPAIEHREKRALRGPGVLRRLGRTGVNGDQEGMAFLTGWGGMGAQGECQGGKGN